MHDFINTIGDYAGIASIFGLAVLSFLYFMQARHVRDLEERATFVPDDVDLPTTPPVSAAARTEARVGAAEPSDEPPAQLEAARQVEVARAAAERRQRFEERRGGPFGGGGNGRGPGIGRPEPRVLAIIGIGVAILLIGGIFLLTRGGSDEPATPSTGADSVQGTGPPKEIAFFNGTPVGGLAGRISKEISGFKVGNISNVEEPYDTSVVMFDKSDPSAQGLAQQIASQLQIAQTAPMNSEVKQKSDKALVAVVVGEDKAGE